MTLASLLVHDVTILAPDFIEDRYGNAIKDWTTPTETAAKGWVSQRDRSEILGDREAEVSEWVLFLHPTVTINGTERVEWGSYTFEVNGPANPAWSPAGLHHLEVPLRVVTG